MQLEEFDIEFLALKMSENPQSMLFARLADLYLTKEQPAEAMKLLEEGIPRYPNYYAAHIVLGKAHLVFKEYSRAFNAFSKALELSPFNQTAAKLLTSVPNKPDESTRTTDENYFTAPGTERTAAPPSNPAYSEPEPAVTESSFTEPVYAQPVQTEEPEFQLPSLEEMGLPQTAAEEFTQAAAEPEAEAIYPVQEQTFSEGATDSFPTYDEYFAQNQHRININAPIRLDDYLSGDAPAVAATEPVIEETVQHEFVNESYVEPEPVFTAPVLTEAEETPDAGTEAITEAHVDPEPVFSSPEQAQLFAELTGMDETPSFTPSTDLDSLTEKLQSAEKIVPQENYQPTTPVPKETADDQAYETDAVTPTLAEIYASQGEYRAAIQAYEILMFSQPAKGGEFQQRIRDLQQLQMEKDGLI